MTRLHFVKKARKPIKAIGVKKGDSYYWWKFAYGAKQCSKEMPPRSRLTQSEFYSAIWDIEDGLDKDILKASTFEEIADAVEGAAQEVRSLGEEQADKASNMEDAFPGGSPTIDLVQGRADRCEEIADELEEVAQNVRDLEGEVEEVEEQQDANFEPVDATDNYDDKIGEARDLVIAISWDTE